MNKKIIAIVGSMTVFILAIVITFLFFSNQFIKTGVSNDKTEILFDVLPNQTMTTVSENLSQLNLIKNKWLFYQYAKIKGANSKLKKGEYSLNQTMTPDEIISVIISGKSVAHNLTVIEGANIFDIAELIEKNKIASKVEFFNLIKDKEFIKQTLGESHESLEGYLFPETYKITKFDTLKEVITQMTKRFLIVWSEFDTEAKKIGWTRNQIIILASIVEKETSFEKDRPLVSSVFHNRLQKKMRLQTDPTVLYGKAMLKISGANTGAEYMPNNITKADLSMPTRFNTYVISALPPTPISNPGRAAIAATLKPANTKFLYFVSRNDGTTAFSENLKDHNTAVQNFQVNAKARQGKSWKDLNQEKK